MRNGYTLCAAMVLAAVQPGCAIVSSVDARAGGQGIAYMLPKALLPVELVDVGDGFDLRVQAPVVVGDPKHLYALQRSGNVFTSDRVVITVDPAKGLLTAIDVKSDDKSLASVIKLASGLRAEAADQSTSVVVHRGLFDPGWPQAEVDSFNGTLRSAAADHVRRRLVDGGCTNPDAEAATCKSVRRLEGLLKRAPLEVSVADGPAPSPMTADCSAGFCYRINLPHEVRLSGGGVSNTAVFGLPNRSPTFVMPLERWAFVNTTHDVKLEEGVFKSVTTDRPSSAFALAAAPFDLAKSSLEAISQVVQLKIDLSGKEKSLAEAKIKELEAKEALEKHLLGKSKGQAEAALWGGGRRTDAWLSIQLGQAKARDAAGGLKVTDNGGNPEPAKADKPAGGGSGGNTSSGSGGNTSSGGSGTKGN
ncbi:MAG: hypothetical protein ACKVQR_18985 [Aquabacterium sp.]